MTNERRQDVCLIAIVISVALHIALMIWARPQVMTRVSSQRRVPKHGPITMREAPPMEIPKEIDFFKDESAKKDAPTADGDVSAPTADEALPMPSSEVALSAPEAPVPDAKVEVENMLSEVKAAPLPVVVDPVKVSGPVDSKPDFMSHVGSDIVVSVPAPTAVPVVAAVPPETLHSSLLPLHSPAESEHVVPEEVLETVDEKFVEREKSAVRRLLDVDNALDMNKAVRIVLEKFVADGWTYFRATVTPKLKLPSVPKDVVILLDASGSIGSTRLASCREASRRILRTCTNTGDRFNLVAFRDRFSYAFKTWQDCTVASFDRADAWLNNVAPFGRTDVFKTISSVLTLPRDPTRPLIALVVTDGDANTGVSDTAQILSKFSKLNDGLVSVYMYGVKSSANRELIDVLTRGNRGESFIFEGSAWRAGSGIEALSNRFRDPVLTDLRVVFATGCPATAYPRLLKNLYKGETVEFVGRVPNGVNEVAFSLKGLNGKDAYESFFRLPLDRGTFEPNLDISWIKAHEIDVKLR